MKKKVAIALVVIICIAAIFAFGRSSGENKEPETTTTVTETTEKSAEKDKNEKETQKDTEKETEKTTEKEPESTTDLGVFTPDEVEKKDPNEIVEFEIPVLFLDAEYQNNLNKLKRDKGYESAEYTWNKKSVKITLKALSYDLYLVKTGISTISAICETFESEDYPYVLNLGEYSEDFSYVTLLVNKKKFQKADNVDDLFKHVSNCCAYYLLQDNDSPNEYKIDICDEKTGELLDSKTFNKKDFLR